MQYPLMRDAVLSEVEWTFASSRYVWGAPDPVAPAWGFPYRFALPTKILRVTFCSNNANEQMYNPNFKWAVEGNYLLSDSSTVYLRVIQRVEDESHFSTLFVQALAARLAMELSVLITENQALHSSMTNLYMAKMQAAATIDSMQGKTKRIRTGQLNGARGGY